jgi:hypothetical protein
MMKLASPILTAVLGLGLLAGPASAQVTNKPAGEAAATGTQPTVTNTRDRQGQVVPVDQLEMNAVDVRPIVSGPNALTPEIKEKLRTFEQFAKAYLREREELRKKFEGASEAERARLRELLKQQYEAYLERARLVREQFIERQRQLMRELPSHREILDNARERARDQLRDTTRERRRGED